MQIRKVPEEHKHDWMTHSFSLIHFRKKVALCYKHKTALYSAPGPTSCHFPSFIKKRNWIFLPVPLYKWIAVWHAQTNFFSISHQTSVRYYRDSKEIALV